MHNDIDVKRSETRYTVNEIRNICLRAIPLIEQWKGSGSKKEIQTLKVEVVDMLKEAVLLADAYYKKVNIKTDKSEVDWMDIVNLSQGGLEIFLHRAR
jgi:hypothetical protein